MKHWIALCVLLSVSVASQAESFFLGKERDWGPNIFREKPWSVFLYNGFSTSNDMLEILSFNYDFTGNKIYSAELSYAFATDEQIHWVLRWLVDTVEFSANYTYRDDDRKDLSEFVGFFMFRIAQLPWNDIVHTTFGIGEGLSYVTSLPEDEAAKTDGDGNHLLNYLAFEATVAAPQLPELQLVGRIHHRSSIAGLMGDSKYGSNILGLGLRYKF